MFRALESNGGCFSGQPGFVLSHDFGNQPKQQRETDQPGAQEYSPKTSSLHGSPLLHPQAFHLVLGLAVSVQCLQEQLGHIPARLVVGDGINRQRHGAFHAGRPTAAG